MHELDDFLEHSGVKGMKWGVHREEKKKGESKRKKSTKVVKAEKSTLRKAVLKSRARRARWDIDHVNVETGEYSNQSKTAKTLRVVDKALGAAMIGAGIAGMVVLQSDQDEKLLHYGVKGMKWRERKDPEEIKADMAKAAEALENAGDEVFGNDSITEELKDVLNIIFGGKGNLKKETAQLMDATKDKLEDGVKEAKKRGEVMLTRMFGKSKPKRTSTTIWTDSKGRSVPQPIVKTVKNPRKEKVDKIAKNVQSKLSTKFEYSRKRPKMRINK